MRRLDLELDVDQVRRLVALVTHTQDAVLTTGPDGTITSWNRGAQGLFGYSEEEAVGAPAAMLVPPDRAGEERLIAGRVLGGERVEHFETRRLSKALVARDVSLTVAPVLDEDGRVVEVATIARDITDRKRAERELERYVADLEALAVRDPSTGLLTRRELHGVLDRELARARREGGTCSLLLVAFAGRPEDPGALRALAELVRGLGEPGQLACRSGDHELALVLPGAGAGAAMALGQRLRGLWAGRSADPGPVGVATGAAAYPAEATGKDELLRRAADALRFELPAEEDAAAPAAPAAPAAAQDGSDTAARILALLRRHLGMEIAYVSEFVGDDQVVRLTDAETPGEHPAILAGAEVPLDGSYCRRMVEGELGHVVADTGADPVTAALAVTEEAQIGCYVGVPVRLSDGRVWGSLCVASRDPDRELDATSSHFARVCARLIADVVEQRELESANRRLQGEVTGVRALLAALDARDKYTGEHSEAVVALASDVGRRLGLLADDLTAIEQVALLHDIGKIGVPDAILQKPGPLTAAEWRVMHEHPAIGSRIVASIPSLAHLATAIRGEHERWDGKGYPDGLAGEAIPLASRVILACDAFHAMTSDRPYRSKMAVEAAAAELRAGAGTQFDPAVVAALLAYVSDTLDAQPAPDRLPRVLVVEDDPTLRGALAEGLTSEGFAIHAVASAPAAYAVIADVQPDVVLLDWWLQEGPQGASACRLLREADPHAAIVMFTGMGDLRDRRAAFDAGATEFLQKGMPLSELAHRLRGVLDPA
jgi:PAS domain S-box-containing protein